MGISSSYPAFEHVMQDVSHVYIGAKLSYGTLMERDDVPFKLRAILAHYMLKEVAPETTIFDHLFFIRKKDLSYLAYKQMKARFKLSVFEEADGKKRKQTGYVSRLYTIDEILADEALRAKRDTTIVEELTFKKFALLGVSL